VAIKHIIETLALHLPPLTLTIESSTQNSAEVVTSELEPTSETATVPTPEPLKATTKAPVEPVTPATEEVRLKRPTLEKRSSVLGSIDKIFWPFGSSSPTNSVDDGVGITTPDSNPLKVPSVTVTEMPLTPEIEI
jgi:hypothetical protein